MARDSIVVAGSLNCDIIFLQERLPERAETYLAGSATVCSGGKGANQAVQAAKLGARTYMLGKLGRDIWGDFLENTISGYGVDTRYLLRGNGVSGLAAVHTLPDGVYYSTVAPGTNAAVTIEDMEKLRDVICNAGVLVLQLEIPIPVVEYLIDIASAASVYIVLNAAPAAKIPAASLAKVDCLIVNEVEASWYLGTTIDSVESVRRNYKPLLSLVKGALIVTLGSQGSVLLEREGMHVYTPTPGIVALETTGSGDSYVGAFAVMKLHGADDASACEFAASVAEYTVTKVGAQASMPTFEEITAYRADLARRAQAAAEAQGAAHP